MTTFPIPDALAATYKGSGHALAAVKDGELRELLYLRDLLPGFAPELVEYAMKDARLAPTIAHLASLGEVSIGMASSWEFTEL